MTTAYCPNCKTLIDFEACRRLTYELTGQHFLTAHLVTVWTPDNRTGMTVWAAEIRGIYTIPKRADQLKDYYDAEHEDRYMKDVRPFCHIDEVQLDHPFAKVMFDAIRKPRV